MEQKDTASDMTQAHRDQWSYFPIQNDDIEDMYQLQRAAFWTKGDLVFDDSTTDIASVDDSTKKLINGVLSIFSQFDGLVGEKVDGFTDHPLLKEFKETRRFFHIQNAIEDIHNEVYGLMLIHYVQDIQEREELLKAATDIPVVKKLADWIERESTADDNLLRKMFINAMVEGVMFQGLFAIIFWVRKTFKGKFHGLVVGNELISRDERLHAEFMVLMINKIKAKLKKSGDHLNWVEWFEKRANLLAMMKELFVILEEFYQYFLPERILDIDSNDLLDYTKVWANILLQSVGHNPRYDVENPLDFMDITGVSRKSNFFEKKATEYTKGTLIHQELNLDYNILG